MSPVEIFGTARCAAMNSACVPLPAPGGPTRTNLTEPPGCVNKLQRVGVPLCQLRRNGASAKEPFVVPLHQLALDLLDRLETHAHHDQHGDAAEREVDELLIIKVDEEEVRQHRD